MKTETPDIYDDLQRKLMDAVFPPGEKLKPADLQGEYGCSPNTIRDVLLRLSRVGLVEFEAQRGFRAKAVNIQVCNDITRFRILLEQEGTVWSMRKGGVAWEAKLSAAHYALVHIERQIEREGDMQGHAGLWSDAEKSFHQILISACDSPILQETHQNIYLQFRQQAVNMDRDFSEGYFAMIIAEHQVILDAVLDRDEESCRQAIHDHLKRNIVEPDNEVSETKLRWQEIGA